MRFRYPTYLAFSVAFLYPGMRTLIVNRLTHNFDARQPIQNRVEFDLMIDIFGSSRGNQRVSFDWTINIPHDTCDLAHWFFALTTELSAAGFQLP